MKDQKMVGPVFSSIYVTPEPSIIQPEWKHLNRQKNDIVGLDGGFSKSIN